MKIIKMETDTSDNKLVAALVAVAAAAERLACINSALWSQSTVDCNAPQSTKNDFARAICNVNNALDRLDAVRAGK